MSAPTGTVTIVFTDIEDSTASWERHGSAFEACLARHNEILREAIAANSGYEVKTEGDAFMVAFQSAGDAIAFAQQAQLTLDAESWAPEIAVFVRVGMHTGEPIVQPDPATGRTDYFGPVVNRAARVAAAGHGGQILLSEAAWSAGRDAFGDAIVSELGEHLLKGLERPERIFQLLPPALGHRQFAPLQTVSAMQTNLPPQSTSFIGRKREVDELLAMLAPRKGDSSAQTKLLRPHQYHHADQNAGVISLIGPGGTGKTRLALRVGTEALDRYEGGVWFADLSAAKGANDAASEVAHALGVRLAGNDDPVETISNVLQYRKPMLLLLDNFEQLAGFSDELVGEWRRRAPHITFMVTTRALLGLKGEQEYELRPMPAPDGSDFDPERLMQFESVALFVQRAREADNRFNLDEKNAADVARICADLEGIPLAVELAASRVKLMKPAQIVKRLEKKFELLKTTRRDTGMRQRTLYDALEWSFDLLTEWERSAFMQGCAFEGGFLLEAAEDVIDLSGFEEAPDVLDALQSLREKSLLRTDEGEFETRFMMYKPIQDFGRNRLAKFGDIEGLYRRHVGHFARFAEEWSERVYGEHELEALNRLDEERSNLVIAQERALEFGDADSAARMAVALTEFLIVRGGVDLRKRIVHAAADALGDEPIELAAKLRVSRSRMEYEAGDLASSLASAERALKLSEACPIEVRCIAHRQMAHACFMLSRMDQLREHANRTLELARESGDGLLLSFAHGTRGILLYSEGNYLEALNEFEEGERLAGEIGYATGKANHTSNRGLILGRLDRRADALDAYEDATEVYRRLGNENAIARMVANSGAQLQMLGRFEEARDAYLKAVEMHERTGHRHGIAVALGNLGAVYGRWLDEPEKARESLQRATALSREMKSLRVLKDHLAQWAYLHTRDRNFAKAAECWHEALEIERTVATPDSLARDLVTYASALADNSQFDEALETLEEAEPLTRKYSPTVTEGRILILRAYIAGRRGKLDEAVALVRASDEFIELDGSWLGDWIMAKRNLAFACKDAGRDGDARTLAGEALKLAEKPGPLGFTRLIRGAIEECRSLAGA